MKFRGVLTDGQQIQCFIKCFQSIARFSERFCVILSENEIKLIVNRWQSLSPFLVKCNLNSDDYFHEYVFRGANNDNNYIYFEMLSENVIQVFNSLLANIKSFKMKLTNNRSNDTVLAIDVDYPTHDADRCVRHDIRVEIIRSQFWPTIDVIDDSSYDISLYCPDYRSITSTIERMNELSENYITIKAKTAAELKAVLSVGVETDSIAIRSKFNDLEVVPNSSDESNNGSHRWVSIRVSDKKLNVVFNTLKHLRPTSVKCNISDKSKIYFQFFHNFVNFQVFLTNIQI